MVCPEGVSRRAVLLGGLGLAVTAACGRGSSSRQAAVSLPDPRAGGSGDLQVALATIQALSGVDQRIAVGLIRGGKPVTSGAVGLAFGADPSRFGPVLPAVYHGEGIPADRSYYAVETRFDHPGEWFVRATVDGQQAGAPIPVTDPAKSKVPVPGRALVRTPTPTVADHRGVEPICTRQPACPFHQVSLDAAMDQGKPIALLFATPKFCESRTCGPVLEVLVGLADAYPNVTFIHAEIWADDKGPAGGHTAPALDAFGLEGEPFLFLAGADNLVRQRLDGPFDRAEARGALDGLLRT
ncbi:MAG: hypothetical protein ACYDAD_08525 [Acidimicrobiales bacterium]